MRCLKFVAMTSCSLGHENRETDGENFLDAAVRREKVLPTEDISLSLTHTHTHTHTNPLSRPLCSLIHSHTADLLYERLRVQNAETHTHTRTHTHTHCSLF